MKQPRYYNPRRPNRCKPPRCHPDRPHFSNGKCQPCYQKHYRAVVKPRYYHDFNAKTRYNLSPAEHKKLLSKKRCMICGKVPKTKKIRHLVIDHNHINGEVRGVLCRQCNANVGWLENRKESIEKYLRLTITTRLR